MRKTLGPALLVAGVMAAGGAAFVPAPAHAQGSQADRSAPGMSERGNPQRDWMESRDYMDRRDRFLRDQRQSGLADRAGVVQGRFGDYPGFGSPWDFGRQAGRDIGREAFERGYQAGREQGQRRRMAEAERFARSGRGPGGGGQWRDNAYQIVPDRLADTLYPEDWPERQLSGTYRGVLADDIARRYGRTVGGLGFAATGAPDGGAFGQGGGRGAGGERDWYLVIPDYFPETRFYRGAQDYVLMPDYTQSMEMLSVATQALREAIQAMAQQPATERRNRAIDRAQEALLTTQAAMVQLPSEMRTR